jgi:hypothetical protein
MYQFSFLGESHPEFSGLPSESSRAVNSVGLGDELDYFPRLFSAS